MHSKEYKVPNVVLEREGLKMQASLTLSEIKELMGLAASNGHKPEMPTPEIHPSMTQSKAEVGGGYARFIRDISDRGRLFIQTLAENPGGMEASELARRIGYTNARQVGGLTGGGLAKVAKRTGVKLEDVYRTEITAPNGIRMLTFYAGKLITK
jgi:hypothetical protein